MGESAYSFSLTTFSPSGKLVQIEYALNAVNAGATSLGIRATNGVVLATEKKLPSILVCGGAVRGGVGKLQGCCALCRYEAVFRGWLECAGCLALHVSRLITCRPRPAAHARWTRARCRRSAC